VTLETCISPRFIWPEAKPCPVMKYIYEIVQRYKLMFFSQMLCGIETTMLLSTIYLAKIVTFNNKLTANHPQR